MYEHENLLTQTPFHFARTLSTNIRAHPDIERHKMQKSKSTLEVSMSDTDNVLLPDEIWSSKPGILMNM